MVRITWQTVRRITKEILGVKGLMMCCVYFGSEEISDASSFDDFFKVSEIRLPSNSFSFFISTRYCANL